MKTQRCQCGHDVTGSARTQKFGTILEYTFLCAACLRRWKTQIDNPNYKPVPDEQLRKYRNDS